MRDQLSPELDKRISRHLKQTNDSWRVDETMYLSENLMDVPVSCCRFERKYHRFLPKQSKKPQGYKAILQESFTVFSYF